MRVIQVGLGGFGRSWAEIARATKGVEFVAAVDPSPAARAWAIDALGLEEATVFADLERALDGTATDAVLVITPPDTHHAVGEVGTPGWETRSAGKAAGDHHRRSA